ncbi:MAG TPA: outer membrane protein assembly factor BamD, partial [Polyangiales bacterium]|nr:outer membrane protein assembly factor BamD [Polyangiales bacterium]
LGSPAHAEPTRLDRYFGALKEQRLVAGQTAKVEELRAILARAEDLATAGQNEDAALLLFELLQHPRFADYGELSEIEAARYQLGSALHELGAEASARRVLIELLRKGQNSGYFAPAFRKYVDVALVSPDQPALIDELAALGPALPEDASNELRYLRGQQLHGAGDFAGAQGELKQVTQHSRFYANAQYLLGAMAVRDKRLAEAEQHMCRITGTGDNQRYSFYVDARYFQVKDLARLGLGRIAHEQRRGDDAFYYYFQVPNDSPRLAEAMFEAAYSRYEAKDFDSAIDLLDQLEARFPRSASADEAALLRGYVALSRCDYEHAQQHFERFIQRFDPVLAEVQRILANPVRREALYAELIQPGKPESDLRATLLALLRVDPSFHELHEQVRKLDAEAARAGRLGDAFDMIGARLAGSDRPREAAADSGEQRTVLATIQLELKDARLALRALTEQLDTMRKLGAKGSELGPLESELASLGKRVSELDAKVDHARLSLVPDAAASSDAQDAQALLKEDARNARAFERRVGELRPKLIRAANDRALLELQALEERLGSFVRRARIGRIDAVMGSKRRIERQIESLAAGRFPAELQNPLLVQGFLNDDEEYWPFEGDDWPDEYLERYGAGEEP